MPYIIVVSNVNGVSITKLSFRNVLTTGIIWQDGTVWTDVVHVNPLDRSTIESVPGNVLILDVDLKNF